MVTISDFQTGKRIYPHSESARKTAFDKHRKFYDDTQAVPEGGPDQDYQYKVNWYRRIAHSYAELLCSDRAEFSVEGYSGFDDVRLNFQNQFFGALYLSVVNMIRFGTGVLAIPFLTEDVVVSYSPDQWYPLYNETKDQQIGDVIVRVLEDTVVIDFYIYGGAPYRRIYTKEGSAIGSHIGGEVGRGTSEDHIYPLPNGYVDNGYGESFYLDIERPINELGRLLGLLSQNVARNSDPTLYGPEGAVTVNDEGEYVIEEGGQYIPVEPGGIPPKYLQWDSETQAVDKGYNLSEELIYVFSSLPRGLFDPSVVSGNSTGSALRRALIPLLMRLSSISAVVKRSAPNIFRKWSETNAPASNFDNVDVTVTFGYESLLGDVTQEETNDAIDTQATTATEE